MKRDLRLARTTEPLKQYLCERNGWCEDTLEMIDWEAHRLGMNRHDSHRTTLIKHMHDILPVGSTVNKWNPIYSPCCPSCPCLVETCQHLHLCPAESRRQWRADLLKSLREKLLEWDTDLRLLDLMMEATYRVLHQQLPQGLPTQGLEDLASSQQKIGWKEFLKGRISKRWAQCQQAYLGNRATKKKNGTTWATNVVDFFLKQWLTLWELRNNDRHGADAEARRAAEKAQAHREVTQLYALKDQLPPDLQQLFFPTLEEHLQLRTYTLRAWINEYKQVLERAYTAVINAG